MDNVLVYIRPWNSEQFKDLSHLIWPTSNKVYISEHKSIDSSGFVENFYGFIEGSAKEASIVNLSLLSEKQIDDVIIRCRLLRSLKKVEALRLISAATQSINLILEQYQPKYILSVTVDSYVIHLLSILGEIKGVRFIGLVPTFINGYFRITATGSKELDRVVGFAELNTVKKSLMDTSYKPTWLASNKKNIRSKARKMWFRNIFKPFWFMLLENIKKERFNAHYMTTKIISKRYWSIFPKGYSGIESVGSIRNELQNSNKKSFFLPLQMSPEATIDYWSSDVDWVDYENKIIDLIRSNSEDVVFLVKEHPNVLGFRTRDFYSKLSKLKNVLLINPEVSSNSILDLSSGVVITTGTVGFEALLRGKPVFSDSAPFYAKEHFFYPTKSISREQNFASTDYDVDELIKYVLSGFLPGNFLNDGSWAKDNPHHKCWNKTVASSIKSNLVEK